VLDFFNTTKHYVLTVPSATFTLFTSASRQSPSIPTFPLRHTPLKVFKERNDSWYVVFTKLAYLLSPSDVRKKTSAFPACSAHTLFVLCNNFFDMRNHFKTTIVQRDTTGTQDYQTATLHFPARATTGVYRMCVELWVRGCFTCIVSVSWKTWIQGWTEYVKPEPWTAATTVSVSVNLQYLYCAVAHLNKYNKIYETKALTSAFNKHIAKLFNYMCLFTSIQSTPTTRERVACTSPRMT
jgi:hypothetical protein